MPARRREGLPVTVATPGNNVDEILRVVDELGPRFDQVVLAGYPPFVKNVVDSGRSRGVDWPALSIRLLLAGEVFSEEWRTLVGERAGMRRPESDSVSLYGTADAGVLGTETPLSVHIRRFLAADPPRRASCSPSPGCRRSCSTTRRRASSRRMRERCCSPATAGFPWCATTSPTRAA
jgi:hypothetical protein